jgi:3'(2'), 5'-bisphosphate nucleotidase
VLTPATPLFILQENPQKLLADLVQLAKQAGQAILEVYHSDFTSEEKTDHSPLTAADLAAHHCLIAGLQDTTRFPAYPVISEESRAMDYQQRLAWETCWMLDPLDGTREFIKRNGEFTVNIALIHRQQPVLGIVYAPVLDICHFAGTGCGAFRQEGDDIPVSIHVRTAPEVPVIAGSRSHGTPEMDALLQRLPPHNMRSMGSSLKFCMIAEGSADFYPRLGPTSEWDTAAADCIVTEAGGRVTDLAGHPLRYNARDTLLNPYFAAFGDDAYPWLDYLSAGV